MSSLPDQVLEEASTIASHLSKQKLVGHLQSEGTSTSEGAVHKIGMQLVQVARNSLLDMNGLRYDVFNGVCMHGVVAQHLHISRFLFIT